MAQPEGFRSEIHAFATAILAEHPDATTAEMGKMLYEELDQAAMNGAMWADAVLRDYAEAGCTAYMKSWARRAGGVGTIHIVPNTEGAVAMTIEQRWRMARKARNADGSQAPGHQLVLWFDLTWDEAMPLYVEQMERARRLNVTVKGMEVALSLRERFPDAATPGEACRLAGINPYEMAIPDELFA